MDILLLGADNMSVVRTTPAKRLFHNYPVAMLQKEALTLDRTFNTVSLSPVEARVNRRIAQAVNEELAARFAVEQKLIEAQQS